MAEAVSGLAHSNTSSSKMGESTSNSSRTIELKRKIRDIEKENEQLITKLNRSTRHLKRLRLEKRFLLERFLQSKSVEVLTSSVNLDEPTESSVSPDEKASN